MNATLARPQAKTFLLLAVPAMISALLNNAYRLIDQYSVQWIGAPKIVTEAQAAIGASSFVLIATYALFLLISAGAGPLIARAEGAQDKEAIRHIMGLSMSAMVAIALIFCLIIGFGKNLIVEAVGLSGNSAQQMTLYLHYLSLSGFFIAFGPLIDAIYIALGNTRFPMTLQAISTALNALLNWIFIVEMQWGIAGAALASGCSRGVVSVIGLRALWRTYKPILQMGPGLRRIVKVGAPIALGTLMYALVYWAMLKVAISPLGPAVNAALGIGFSALEGVSWPLYAGIMMAVSSLIGRQLGANRPDLCDETIRIAFRLSTVVGGSVAIVFYVAAEPLCALFSSDPETYNQAVLYAKILAFSQLFVAYEALTEGILAGAGDTKTVFWISAPINIFRIPLSWLLAISLNWHAAGVWWAINITTYAKALLKGFMVKRGRWKEIEP